MVSPESAIQELYKHKLCYIWYNFDGEYFYFRPCNLSKIAADYFTQVWKDHGYPSQEFTQDNFTYHYGIYDHKLQSRQYVTYAKSNIRLYFNLR